MDRSIDRRSLVLVASSAASLALVPAVMRAQATPEASPVATIPLPPDQADAIRSAISDVMTEEGIPGAAVHLVLPGYEPFAEPFGVSDKATDTAMTMETHFRIGSITKTFVGTVVLQLVDEGMVSLDDTIDTWDFQVPNADRITVRNLLNMTSGLQNYTETEAFAAAMNADPTQPISPDEAIAMVGDAPRSEPGEAFYYNNTNFIILGRIAETVTGESLEDLLQTRIFDVVPMPNTGLGLDATMPEPFAHGYGDADPEIPEEMAEATPIATPIAPVATPDSDIYTADDDGHYDTTDFNPAWAWAAGSAWSTVDDLVAWLPVLVGGELLSPEVAAERMDWVPFDPSSPELGGYGLALFNLGGLIGHNGQIPGYSSIAVVEPETGLTAVVLTNLYPGSTMMMTPETQILNAAVQAALPLLGG